MSKCILPTYLMYKAHKIYRKVKTMEQDFISQTTLDQMVSNDSQQMLKAAIPYLPPSGRQIFSIYTKLMELSNTLSLFSPARQDVQICSEMPAHPLDMLQDIQRFCYGKSRHKIDQMVNMFAMIQMLQIMQESPEKKG